MVFAIIFLFFFSSSLIKLSATINCRYIREAYLHYHSKAVLFLKEISKDIYNVTKDFYFK